MPRAAQPAWQAGGRTVACGRPELRPGGPGSADVTAIHGILIGCVTSAPFWLALLAFTLR